MTATADSKACTKCGLIKPFSEFHKCASNADGLQGFCKPCKADAQRKYRGTPPKIPQPTAPEGHRYCTKCKCIKQTSAFGKSTVSPSGLRSWCQDCCHLYHAEWRVANSTKPAAPEKQCPDCGVTKPASDYSRSRGSKDGLCYCCKPCWAKRLADRVAKNEELFKARRQEYQARYAPKRAEYKAKNADRIKALNKAYNDANKERKKAWNSANAERRSEYSAAYRAANRARVIAVDKEWRNANKGRVRANELARLYNKLQATPAWSDLDAISAVYLEAKRLEAEDGISRHVDHIIPIKHKLVCGLHVPSNLQILTAFENQSKGNRFKVQ